MSDNNSTIIRDLVLISIMLLSSLFGWAQTSIGTEEQVTTMIQSGHYIKHIDISADRRYVLTSDGHTVALWDFEKRRIIKMVTMPNKGIMFHPLNPTWVMAVPVDDYYKSCLYTYNIFTGKRLGVRKSEDLPNKWIWMNDFSLDRKDGIVEVKSRRTGQLAGRLDGGYGFKTGAIALNHTDSLLLQTGLRPLVWDLKNAEIICQIPYLDFLKKDPGLYFKDDFTIPIPSTDSLHIKKNSFHYGYRDFYKGNFSEKDEILLGGYNQYITRWSADGNLLGFIETAGKPVYAFVDNGNDRAAATYKGLNMGPINDTSLEECQSFNAKSNYKLLYDISRVFRGKYFLTGGDDHKLLMGEFGKPNFRKSLISFSSPLTAFDVDHLDCTALVGGESGILYEVPIDDSKSFLKYNTSVFRKSRVDCVSYLNDGWFAAGCTDGVLGFWKQGITDPLQTEYVHKNQIIDIEVSHNRKWILSADINGMIRIWDAATRTPLMDIHHLGLENDYVFITPDNYYKASKGAFDKIHFVKGMKVLSFEQFDLIYNRPDIVLERLGQSAEQTRPYYLAWKKRLRRMGYTEDMLSGEINAPEVTVINKSDIPLTVTERNISISLQARDEKYRLSKLFISLNGVPLYGKRGMDISGNSSSVYENTVKLGLCQGNNRIDISCMNEKGVESYREQIDVVCEANASKPSLFIASIGVSEYSQKGFNLNYASKDATDFANMMANAGKGRYSDIRSMLLTDKDFSKNSLSDLKEFFKEADRDDVVMLFYAGHGVLDSELDYYLSTHSIDFDSPSVNGVNYDDFESVLEATKSVHRFCFVDACHSGELDKEDYSPDKMEMKPVGKLVFRNAGSGARKLKGNGIEQIQTLFNELFVDVRWGIGATILSSAGGMEVALEGNQWENGLFTWCLKEALLNRTADSDNDGKVSTNELIDYVSNEVRRLSGGAQTPSVRQGNRQQNYIFIE